MNKFVKTYETLAAVTVDRLRGLLEMVQDHYCTPTEVLYKHCLLAHSKIRPNSATVTAANSESSHLVDLLERQMSGRWPNCVIFIG